MCSMFLVRAEGMCATLAHRIFPHDITHSCFPAAGWLAWPRLTLGTTCWWWPSLAWDPRRWDSFSPLCRTDRLGLSKRPLVYSAVGVLMFTFHSNQSYFNTNSSLPWQPDPGMCAVSEGEGTSQGTSFWVPVRWVLEGSSGGSFPVISTCHLT